MKIFKNNQNIINYSTSEAKWQHVRLQTPTNRTTFFNIEYCFTWKSHSSKHCECFLSEAFSQATPFACIITQRTTTWSAKLTFQLWSPRCLIVPGFSDVQVLLRLWQTAGDNMPVTYGSRPAQACINSYIKHRPSHTALMLFEAPSLLDQSSCAALLSHDSLLQWFKPGLPSSVTQTESNAKQPRNSRGTRANGKAELK